MVSFGAATRVSFGAARVSNITTFWAIISVIIAITIFPLIPPYLICEINITIILLLVTWGEFPYHICFLYLGGNILSSFCFLFGSVFSFLLLVSFPWIVYIAVELGNCFPFWYSFLYSFLRCFFSLIVCFPFFCFFFLVSFFISLLFP